MHTYPLLALAVWLIASPSAAAAQADVELRIGVDEGAIYDGILDGFPGIAVLDGSGDLPGNQLGAALRRGVTEERAVAEFPLARQAASGTLSAAILTFNIDDVLSTFGPGTEFNGRAAPRFFLHAYAADGNLAVDDFARIENPPVVIETATEGAITDTTLAITGPVVFSADVTEQLQAIWLGPTSHAGFVWRVEESPTGTSIDDLGEGSAGPPGIGGATLPYLTLYFSAPPTPAPTAIATTPTPTPETPAACDGDCNRDLQVTVDEVVALVAIALGNQATTACPTGDTNADGQVTVDEVVNAIGRALSGCSAA